MRSSRIKNKRKKRRKKVIFLSLILVGVFFCSLIAYGEGYFYCIKAFLYKNQALEININSEIKSGIIKVGFGDVGTFDIKKRRSILQIDGIWEIGKNISLGHGTKISIGKNGILKMGNNITITAETAIICHKDIKIGNGCLISWDNLIMDTDFHKIYSIEDVKKRKNNDLPINIGNDVWIGCRCTILKGSNIKNMSVISSNSRISSNISKENVVIGDNGLILKEKINLKQISAIIVAFIGALFIIKPSFDIRVVPYMIGFLSAVFAALAYTYVRMLGNKEEYYTIVFFFSTFSLIAVLPAFILVYEPMSMSQLIYLVLAGIFASLGQFGITLAYKYAPAKEISIFDYSNIIFSAILSIFLFGVYPDKLSVVGYFIIFAAALYMFIYNKRQDKLAK